MDPLEQAIEELKKELGEDVITTGSTTPRPEKAIIREAFDDFNERNPLAGGGMLVQPSADGSRPGYKNERRVLGDPITIDGKQYKKVIEGPDKGKYVIREGQNNPRQFVNKSEIKKTVKANIEKGKQNLKEMYAQRTVLNKRTTANRSKWIKNWLNKNLNKYNVREFNNFQNDLLNDFNAEVEKNPNKYGTSRKDFLLTKDGFPVYGDQKIGGEIYDGISFTRAGADRNQLLSYQKIFFKNKLKDKDFKAKVNSYLDWNLTKKVKGGAGSMAKTAALDYGKFKKGFDDDVIYLMGEVLNNKALNPGGGQIGINDIFKKSIGKKADAYFKKYQGSWTRWLNNFYEVASLAGLDKSQADALIQKQKNDSQKIMRLFNVKKLPPEFVVAQDHLFGLAEAKALGDPKIARQTLRALVATTKEQNRILGQEGFSGKRTALIRRFKNASLENKANIVNQLNTLSEEYVPGRLKYDVKKDGSLKITNLQPEPTLKSKATAYRDLAKNFPVNIKNNFFKFFKNKKYGKIADVLVKAGKDGGLGNVMQVYCARKKAKGGRIFLSEGSGCPAARQDPEQFLKDISKDKNVARFFNSTAGKKAATAAARVGLNVINPSTLIGGEVAYVLADGLNNFSKGMDFAESFDRAFIFADFKFFDEAIMNKAKELKFDDNQLKVLQETMNINRLDNEIGKLDAQDRIAEADKSLETPFANTQVRDKVNKQLDQSVDNYLSTLRGMGFKFDNVSDYDTGFNYLDNVFKKKTQDELVKTYQARARQVDPTSGKLGNVLDPILDLDAYTQPLKYAADIVNPFTKNVPFKSKRQREADRLREMEGRELYLYNKQRGFDLDSITDGTSPYISEVMQQLGGAPTGEGMFASFAGGGIAGLSGGIDEGPQRISMNPDSQGLSGLLKNGKKT